MQTNNTQLLLNQPNKPFPIPTPASLKATEAESKDDREIVCEEVFVDVTGRLDAAARARLGVATGDACFYQVLAPYYLQVRGHWLVGWLVS